MIRPIQSRPISARSILARAIQAESGGEPEDCRYYYNFDGVDDYFSIPTTNLNGEFEVSLRVKTSQYGTTRPILGDASSETYYIRPDSQFSIKVGGFLSSLQLTGVNLPLNESYNLRISFTGGVYRVFVNGDMQTAIPGNVGNIVVNAIAGKGVGRFLGIISNFKIYTGGDKDTGTLLRSYAIDDNSTTIVDSIGGQNGTLINGDPASWEYICENSSDWIDGESWNDGEPWID